MKGLLRARWTVAAVLAMLTLPLLAGSAPPAKDTLSLEGAATQGGSSPAVNGANLVYAYSLQCYASLSDRLHVSLTIDNTDGVLFSSYQVSFTATGDTSDIVATLPPAFGLLDLGQPTSLEIPVAAAALAPGDYEIKIQVLTDPGASAITQSNPKDIQVMVHVDDCGSSEPTCFFTDSAGDFLSDCAGNLVSESDGGRFAILSNKKGKVISTNPGQFYYNYVWPNTGLSPVEVEIQLGGLSPNLTPQGANAVHAYTFGTAGFTQDAAAFDMVNQDGTPCGPDGSCTITVGNGETLWVTWHLEFVKGLDAGDWGASCGEASAIVTAEARLVDAGSGAEVAPFCRASAAGYLKK